MFVVAAIAILGCAHCKRSTFASAVSTSPDASLASIEPPSESPPVVVLAREYRGTIDAKLAIIVRLERVGGDVYGSYFYERNGIDLALTGKLEGARLTLDESANKKKTGSIRAEVAPDGAIAGTWTNAKGDKSLPLRLTAIVPPASPASALVFKKSRDVILHGTDPVATCTSSIETAEVFGLAPDVEAKINALLALPKHAEPTIHDGVCSDANSGFDVLHNADGIFSERLDFVTYSAGAVHPNHGVTTANVLLRDGTSLKLFGDVLAPKGRPIFDAAIATAIRANSDLAQDDVPGFDVPATLRESQDFVLENTGVRVVTADLAFVVQSVGIEGVLIRYASLPSAGGPAAALWKND